MHSDIKIRFGKTRGTPVHFFRVQVSRDGGQRFTDALVMKRDDKDGPDRNSTPYRVEWAATKELEQEVEATLSKMEERYSAKHTKNELRKFLKALILVIGTIRRVMNMKRHLGHLRNPGEYSPVKLVK